MTLPGGVIRAVEEGSLAREIGLEPGDRVVSIDGHPLRDVLDYRFHIAESQVEIEVRKPDGQAWLVSVEKDPDETLGVTFQTQVFDGIIRCQNRCPFCFVDQMPPGLRDSLYIKDDDYRLSFMGGNFVTLTNLEEEDLERIKVQRLSPLYVSVHATDQTVRERLLGRKGINLLEILRQLTASGIDLHCQIVIVPGLNDGPVLDQTLADLAEYFPRVLSIGVVPVGLTHHRKRDIPPVGKEEAARLIRQVGKWQERFQEELGDPRLFLADEIYLKAGVKLPSLEHYGEFPQLENGIGAWRLFEAEFRQSLGKAAQLEGIILTGVLAAPLIHRLVAEYSAPGSRVKILSVLNRWLGDTVTVAGLMGGRDVVDTLIGEENSRDLPVLLPASSLRGRGEKALFLDQVSLGEVSKKTGRVLLDVPASGQALARALAGKEIRT